MKRTKEVTLSWIETHYEVVAQIESYRNRLAQLPQSKYSEFSPSMIVRVQEEYGTTGFWQLAEEMTDRFEKKNEGRYWDGEFFDEIEEFAWDYLMG